MNCGGYSGRWPTGNQPIETYQQWCPVCGRMTRHNSGGCAEHGHGYVSCNADSSDSTIQENCPHPYVVIQKTHILNTDLRPHLIQPQEPVERDFVETVDAYIVLCSSCFTTIKIFKTETLAREFQNFYNNFGEEYYLHTTVGKEKNK